MALADNQKAFIGSTFNTPKGGLLTVTSLAGKKGTANVAVFNLHCSICSMDEKLWGEGTITSTKGMLNRGLIPCGCSKIVNWSEEQNKVRVERECKVRGYIFHGWSGKYKKVHTKLVLEDKSNADIQDTLDISRFMKGEGDPRNTLRKDKHLIDSFIEGGFTEGYTFWRSKRLTSDGAHRYWFYTCPICSEDDFVKKGLCSGVFEAQDITLKNGSKSCRCNRNNYRWSQDQREYQICTALAEEGATFLRWEDEGYINAESKFEWECSKGHLCKSSTSSFLNSGCRCRNCSGTGYDSSKKGILYLVEWYGQGESFLKKGITNSTVIKRVTRQASVSILEYKILREISGDGKIIADFEKYLNKKYKGNECPKDWFPDGYTETVRNTPCTLKALNKDFDKLEEILANTNQDTIQEIRR